MKKAKLFKPTQSSAKFEFNGRKNIDEMYKNKDWVDYRKRFLDINTKCYSCGSVAAVVDHIEPHKGNITKFEKLDNHLPLCSKCHNTITALFDRHVVPKFTEKLKWLKRNRDLNEVYVRVKVLTYYKRT